MAFSLSPPLKSEWFLQETSPWHQVGLGFVGTMGLSQVWAGHHLSYTGIRCLLVTYSCCGLHKSTIGSGCCKQVPLLLTRHGGETYSARGDSLALFSAEICCIPAPMMILLVLRAMGFAFHQGYWGLVIYYCCHFIFIFIIVVTLILWTWPKGCGWARLCHDRECVRYMAEVLVHMVHGLNLPRATVRLP